MSIDWIIGNKVNQNENTIKAEIHYRLRQNIDKWKMEMNAWGAGILKS